MSSAKVQQCFVGIGILLCAALFTMGLFSKALHPAIGATEVSIAEALALMEAGAIVVDVRGREAFEAHHIPGALHVPLETLRAGIPEELQSAKDRNIVVYCSEGRIGGPEGASVLKKAGFSRAVNLKSGLDGWTAAGHSVTKG